MMNRGEGVSRDVVFSSEGEVTRVPHSELELNQMVIDGRWGDMRIHSELYQKLTIPSKVLAKAGTQLMNPDRTMRTLKEDEVLDVDEFLWAELSFFTRDFRLGNLDRSDYAKCNHYTLLAADLLRMGFRKAFIVCLARVATILELSQSKRGFLREWFSTIRKIEEKKETNDRPSLILGGKK